MAVRPATDADIPNLRLRLGELTRPVFYGDNEDEIIERIKEAHLDNPDESTFTDPAGNIWASVALNTSTSARVRWLFPRADWKTDNSALLLPVLASAIIDFAANHPLAEEDNWVIEAKFQDGRDATGNLDGGRAACEFWRDRYFKLGATRANIRQDVATGEWYIWWTFRPVLRIARAVVIR